MERDAQRNPPETPPPEARGDETKSAPPASFSLSVPREIGAAAIFGALVCTFYLAGIARSVFLANPSATVFGITGLIGVWLLVRDFGKSKPKLRSEPRTAVIQDGKLYVGGLVGSVAELGDVQVTARQEQTTLTLAFPDRRVSVCFVSQAEARRFLRALGIKPLSKRIELAMPSRVETFSPSVVSASLTAVVAAFLLSAMALLVMGLPVAAIGVAGLGLASLGTVRALALAPSTRVWVRPGEIEWAWGNEHHHIRYADVESYEVLPDACPEGQRRVELVLRSGERVRFSPRSTRERELLFAGLRRFQPPERLEHGAILDAVRRRGRPLEDWLSALRALGAGGAADLRAQATNPDALERLATDPDARASDRVAAAIALKASGRTEGVRIAPAVSDPPHVRVALGRMSPSATDDELLDALEEASRDEPQKRLRGTIS